MPPPPPNPESQNKTVQEFNGALNVLVAVLENETLIIHSTVVSDSVLVSTVIKPPIMTPFLFQMDIPPQLPPPLLTPYPPHVTPQLTTALPPPIMIETLPLILLPPPPSNYFADK